MKVQIQTTQNVNIEFDLATLSDRMAAKVIDILILLALTVFLNLILAGLLVRAAMEGDGMATRAYYIACYVAPWVLYWLVSELVSNGQSFGKKAMQIKVVRLDGVQPSFVDYLVRWLVGLLEMQLLLGGPAIAAALLSRNGQRLGDMAAGTTVVKVKRGVTLTQTILARVDENHEVTFPQVSLLSDTDIAIIKEVITSRERAGNPVVLGTLTRRVKEAMQVETALPSLKFLRTVVRDYNSYYTES